MLSRRTFIGWMGSLGAAVGLGARSVEDGGEPMRGRGTPPSQAGGLDPVAVTRIGEAVLPGELGDAGIARVSRAFVQWAAGYRPGAEQVHPYGSPVIRVAGPSPVPRWRSQLADLDRAARSEHRRAFAALTRDQRRALLLTAMSADAPNRMPDPLGASHVALALMAWYFGTPDATDLCYRARIGRNQCRPLVNAHREPLPLADGGRGAGSGKSPSVREPGVTP